MSDNQTAGPGLSGSATRSPATSSRLSEVRLRESTCRVRDATRLATSKLLADEQKETDRWIPGPCRRLVLLSRGITWFGGSSQTTAPTALEDWRKALVAPWNLRKRGPPHQALTRRRPNGKANGSSTTHPGGWASVIGLHNIGMNATAGYPAIWGSINAAGCHIGLGVLTPQQCLQRLLIA